MIKLIFIIIFNFLIFNLYSQSYSYVKVVDKPLYNKYLTYCNTLVLDTVMFVGYKKGPIIVTYVNNYTIKGLNDTIIRNKGTYHTYTIVVNYNSYNNESRKKKYKNVSVTQPKLPVFTPPKYIHFTPIIYYCYQRKPSIRDFYTWYYLLPIKP